MTRTTTEAEPPRWNFQEEGVVKRAIASFGFKFK